MSYYVAKSSFYCKEILGRMKFIFILLMLLAATKHYICRIKTESGSIIGTTVQATDADAAKVKVLTRYPNATILSVKEK